MSWDPRCPRSLTIPGRRAVVGSVYADPGHAVRGVRIGQSASAGSLTYTAPAAWHARPASNSMRVAEFVVPKAAGDPEDAEVIIYYFGGQ